MKNKSVVKILSVAMLMFGSIFANAQGMAVNTSGASAAGSAMLDVSSTTQGVLVPRMTTAQKNAISSPATGLLVYQTDGTAGFYFYNGSAWTSVGGGSPTGAAGGDLTGTYPNPTLGNTAISPGTYGSATQVPVLTVDSKGRLTAGSTTAITGVTPGGAAGGDLTGTYPNPTIASLAVTGAKIANTTISVGKLNATGTASSSTYLRGDGTWSTPSSGGSNPMTVVSISAGGSYTLSDLSLRTIILDFGGVNPSGTSTTVTLPAANSYTAGTIIVFNATAYATSAPTGFIVTSSATGTQTYSGFNANNVNISTGNTATVAGGNLLKVMSDGGTHWYKMF